MNYNSLVLWDATHGIPQHLTEDGIQKFLSSLNDKHQHTVSETTKFVAVQQAIQAFANEALAYLDDQQLYRHLHPPKPSGDSALLTIEHIPLEFSDEFVATVAATGAQLGLAVLYFPVSIQGSKYPLQYALFLPDGTTHANNDKYAYFIKPTLIKWRTRLGRMVQYERLASERDTMKLNLPLFVGQKYLLVDKLLSQCLADKGLKSIKFDRLSHLFVCGDKKLMLVVTAYYGRDYEFDDKMDVFEYFAEVRCVTNDTELIEDDSIETQIKTMRARGEQLVDTLDHHLPELNRSGVSFSRGSDGYVAISRPLLQELIEKSVEMLMVYYDPCDEEK